MATLSKPLVVPQYGNYHQNADGSTNYNLVDQKPFTVNLFEPDGAGNPTLLASIDMTVVAAKIPFGVPPNTGFPDYVPSPNVCAIVGEDLYVSVSAYQAQPGYTQLAAIVQFAGYFTGKNATANFQASTFTANAGSSYVGMAFDGGKTLGGGKFGAGYLYVVQDSGIQAFPVGPTGTSNTSNPPGTVISTGAGQTNTSFFGDMAFDAGGNLWVADYNNNSVLAFPNATLGTTNAFAIVAGGAGPFPVVSTLATPPAQPSLVFASPEGVAFDGAGNLWVGNNNDGYNAIGQKNPLTTLVQITPAMQQTILGQAAAGGKTVTLAASAAFTTLAQVKTAAPPSGFAIYALPTPGGAAPQFGGIQIDSIGNTDLAAGKPQYLYVNDEVYQTVRQFDINPFSAGFIAGIGTAAAMNATALNLVDAEGKPVVSNPGNGGIALVRANLLIGDAPTGAGADTGVEPDNAIALNDGGVFWESNNLGVYVEASGAPPALTPPFDNTVDIPLPAGKDVYVYVNVRNFGCTATTGTERLRVYWASGATAQAWPESWSEITSPTSPVTLGGIAAGASQVVPVLWPSGNYPSDPADPTNTHYCLLARIETAPVYPFGMTYWEQQLASGPVVSNMYYNVASNARIAQRNIFFGAAMHRREGNRGIEPVPIVIKAGNLGTTRSSIRLGFQLFGPTGAPAGFDGGRLVIHAKGHESLCERLLELAIEIIDDLGDGLFHIKDPVRGLTHFSLAPKEMLPIHLAFTPPPGLTNLALRAIQYDITDGKSRLVGGQTFVFGTVVGFNA